jgi:hypothetical protein
MDASALMGMQQAAQQQAQVQQMLAAVSSAMMMGGGSSPGTSMEVPTPPIYEGGARNPQAAGH